MTNGAFAHSPIRSDWLALRSERPLAPDLPVVDAHHHLYDRAGHRYLFDEFLADMDCGHGVRASVFVQARAMYRADGPEPQRPIGETEFANGVAAMSASGAYGPSRLCSAIVGFADLAQGSSVREVLERHVVAGGGRFRGVRQSLAWDTDAALFNATAYSTSADMMESTGFRSGFAQLAPLGLSFDAWLLFPQIPKLTALARAFPETSIVLDHCGGVLGIGRFEGRRDEVFVQWKASMAELAHCPNVNVKLSGLGMRLSAFGFEEATQPPSSELLADAWRPWMETCIELFGAERCMYGSNFPVDKGCYSYGIGLNAVKRIVSGASAAQQEQVMYRSAARFYRLPEALFASRSASSSKF